MEQDEKMDWRTFGYTVLLLVFFVFVVTPILSVYVGRLTSLALSLLLFTGILLFMNRSGRVKNGN